LLMSSEEDVLSETAATTVSTVAHRLHACAISKTGQQLGVHGFNAGAFLSQVLSPWQGVSGGSAVYAQGTCEIPAPQTIVGAAYASSFSDREAAAITFMRNVADHTKTIL
jgi:hypothetical protein